VGFLTKMPTEGMTAGGNIPGHRGHLFLVIIMSIVGVPVGTITAIYLSEYVKEGSIIGKTIRFAVNTLAGIRRSCSVCSG